MPSPETSRAGAATPGRRRAGGRPEGDRLGAAQLARGGFQDSGRAARLLAEVLERMEAAEDDEAGATAGTDADDATDRTDDQQEGTAADTEADVSAGTAPGPRAEVDVPGLVADLGAGADPDAALLLLVRLLDPRSTGADGTRCDEATLPVVAAGGEPRRRLLTLLGGSVALGEGLLRHPEHVPDVAEGRSPEPWTLVEAVRGLTGRAGADALRVAYRRQLLRVATADLCSPDPVRLMPAVGGALADLAAAALEGALLLARAEVEDEESCALTVVAMGKTGGRELNYLSDVDVIFLAAPQAGAEEAEAVAVGARLASAVMRICGDATAEGTLWQVDAALRPEGKNGPLVRSLESHREYYQRWAKTWEFQALLKARVVAGDGDLGRRWLELVEPLVWEAAGRENFVGEVQSMRRRVEQHVRRDEVDRQIKLGPGGLRDIEFSVQLLQLVHGRADPALRSRTTLEALAALRDGGYVGREDAHALDEAYRLLRCLEHRVQLHRMKRTHLMPTAEGELRRLGRALGERGDADRAVMQRWKQVRREVRRLHERLFYRPLLSAVARLSYDEARLSPEAARERLAALGFRDPAGAMRHLEALTDGVSRRATIQRHLLPVMLSWFADGADPDAGLLAFRRISDALGTTHWYLGMLRDEGSAAQRLARVLSSSRYAVDLLIRSPETVALLGDEGELVVPDKQALVARMTAAARRQESAEEAFASVRSVRARELVRIVLGDLAAGWDGPQVRQALSDLTDAYLEGALGVATRRVLERRGEDAAAALLLVGMGRLGGREVGYASDADVMYVYDPLPGATPELAAEQATDIVAELRKGLTGAGPDPVLELDAGLRPEGKAGPLVRSLEAYRTYYERWSAGWESQALLRARPVAGDPRLGEAFSEMIRPLRWPDGGIGDDAVRQIRKLKARMEAERLPRGADPRTHLKLGMGGLSDVEWVAQLLQLQHAHDHPGLRTTSTIDALRAAGEAGLLSEQDQEPLVHAWCVASQLRDAGIVWRGRPVDSVPSDLRDAEGMSRVMRRGPGTGTSLAQDWRRTARHAREVVERLLYGNKPPGTGGDGETLRRATGAPHRGRPDAPSRDRHTDGFGRPRAASPPRDAGHFPPPRRDPFGREARGRRGEGGSGPAGP
ncbi:bifunctional [glutamine synthetase] adenylyltransferase/[glutamine synthetase]-adenylyl-L-tyrosine phosphorylase [Serinicoccus sediminis]|uniref:bifunctional [glutamine synthetase] adenylyltransferase/[glutamine synthetase]-adenylyl-L-tyrosine phosphorylase n=1 Tax=Serinicoccus sediminis TaxID=2306021 RepID=UPI0023548BF9|nr:bifunctional [glutamine synthetase] adenylyltransferase/[glutamine synthetase]-adenylyl-L-tyrosine phosphorylase [Serinicoccus sediminis]